MTDERSAITGYRTPPSTRGWRDVGDPAEARRAVRVVIVGGVAGGMSAATRLRRLDADASITVLERSGHVSFANCGLPYFVGGLIEAEEDLTLQTPQQLFARFCLDARVENEHAAGAIPGSINLPIDSLHDQLDSAPSRTLRRQLRGRPTRPHRDSPDARTRDPGTQPRRRIPDLESNVAGRGEATAEARTTKLTEAFVRDPLPEERLDESEAAARFEVVHQARGSWRRRRLERRGVRRCPCGSEARATPVRGRPRRSCGGPGPWSLYSHPSRCHAPSVDAATPVELDVSGPLLSQHLAVLRDAGIFNAMCRGRSVDSTLDHDASTALVELIAAQGAGVGR